MVRPAGSFNMVSKLTILIHCLAITFEIGLATSTSSSVYSENSCDPNLEDAKQNTTTDPRRADSKYCVMYGICDNEAGLPCEKHNFPPSLLYGSQAGRFCSEILTDPWSSEVCCDENQTDKLTQLLYMPESLLGKCPSCFNNLVRTLCLISCSANQSQWMQVRTISGSAVEGVAVYISPEYANEVYESCKDVNLVVTGKPMTDHLCGRNENSSTCNAEKWFTWIGNPTNGLTHFQIDFEFGTVPGGMTLFSDQYSKCFQAPNSQTKACACADCPGSCFETTEPTTESDSTESTEDSESSGTDVMWKRTHTVTVIVTLCLVGLTVFVKYLFE